LENFLDIVIVRL